MRPFALSLLAALALLPLAADARTPPPPRQNAEPPPTEAGAPRAARPSAATSQADLSTLRTTEYGSAATRGPARQDNPAHTYNRRGVDCTLYPARCR